MDFLKKRFSEGSSYAGLAAVAYGLGEFFKVNEAPAVVEAISEAGAAAAGGGWLAGLIALAGGIAIAVKDKE